MKKILLLTDPTGYLWGKHMGSAENYTNTNVDVEKIKAILEERKYNVQIKEFSEALGEKISEETFVLYASSEDRGGFYKEYIEDILLGLEMQRGGVHLIPSFYYFKAHENKNFQEILKKNFKNKKLQYPTARAYGCYQELLNEIEKQKYPCVVKTADGSGSRGVSLVKDEQQLLQKVKNLSENRYYNYYYTEFRHWFEHGLGYLIKRCYHKMRGIQTSYKMERSYTNKFIIQEFIPNLTGDFKILYFAGKYYVLFRKNRDQDFRASGSGKFEFPDKVEDIENVLNFARECVEEIAMPMISLDIGVSNKQCYMIEFQCVSFGTYTLEYSSHYYIYDDEDKNWKVVIHKSDIEEELANAIDWYINRMESLT